MDPLGESILAATLRLATRRSKSALRGIEHPDNIMVAIKVEKVNVKNIARFIFLAYSCA